MTFWSYVTGDKASRKRRKDGSVAMQNYNEVNQEISRRMKQAQTDVKKLILGFEQETSGRLATLQQKNRRESSYPQTWTEYWTELYNHKLQIGANILTNKDQIENRETGIAPIPKETVEQYGR